MESPEASPARFPWVGCLVTVVVLVIVAAIAIPGLLSSSRSSNDRNASFTLKTIAAAEADFRGNDRDGNKINDFWTADVKGLYTVTSAAVRGAPKEGWNAEDPAIRLIELSVAAADGDGQIIPAGGENMPLSLFAVPSPKAGYWFAALERDLTASGPDAMYKVDTGGEPPMGSCHNLKKFGFVAFPDSLSAGVFVFIVNESNLVYRSAASVPVKSINTAPPGLKAVLPVYLNWPDEKMLKQYWSKLD